jgi:2-hydroxychromene-2-carboxylate isomerase
MTSTIEFYFDFGSPTAFLAYQRLKYIAQEYHCEINFHPVLLGGIFKATGNQSPVMLLPKAVYMNNDLQRFATRYDTKLAMNPHFPINTITLMRIASALVGKEEFSEYVDTIYRAMWQEEKNLGDLDVLREVLEQNDLQADKLLEMAANTEVKDQLRKDTEEAVDKGFFGLPVMYFQAQMYFGQDRLFFIEEELEKLKSK